MKKLLTLLLFCPLWVSAQLGARMDKIISFIGADQVIRTDFKYRYIVQDIKTGNREITTIYYTMDSIATMVSVSRKDSSFIMRDLVNFRKNNIPDYKGSIKCMEGTTTYHWDTVHQILLMINYDTDPVDPHITGFAATRNRDLINAWTAGNKAWRKE